MEDIGVYQFVVLDKMHLLQINYFTLLYLIGICQYQLEIHNPRKLGPLNLELYVLIDSGKVDIKRIEFRII